MLVGGGGRRVYFYLPCWFSLSNSETVKAVTLAFCSIQLHFVRNIRAKFDIPNLSDIGKYPEGGISEYKKIVITPEPVMILTLNVDQ